MNRDDPLTQALDQAALRRRLPDPETRRLLRRRCGLTQAQLADALGVSRACVAHYEGGIRTPRGRLLDAYVHALDRLAAEVASAIAPKNGSGPDERGRDESRSIDREDPG